MLGVDIDPILIEEATKACEKKCVRSTWVVAYQSVEGESYLAVLNSSAWTMQQLVESLGVPVALTGGQGLELAGQHAVRYDHVYECH